MNTPSQKSRVGVRHAIALIAVLFLPALVTAGVFYLPPQPVQTGYASVTWYGTYGMSPGVQVPMQVKAPGETTWTTVAYGVTGYYGSCAISTQYNFNVEGTWMIRAGGDTASLYVSAGGQASLQSAARSSAPIVFGQRAVAVKPAISERS